MDEQPEIDPVYKNPVNLLQHLIRFDTTNPPGNERECITFIRGLLSSAEIESRIFAIQPERANLLARIKGRGEAPPLLLYGHVDVVSTDGQRWRYPPFDARIVDGFLWGRGTLDMKGGVAMMLSAFIRAHDEKLQPAGDIVLAILADEEAGGDMGAGFLVDKHPEQFEGIRYALGEVGGHTFHLDGTRFYPIQVAEKQLCWMRATIRGSGGHGARPMRDGAMAKLGRFLTRLDQNRLPVHITRLTRQMVETMAAVVSQPISEELKSLLEPAHTDSALERLGENGRFFEPLLRNTVNATIVRGGNKVNVIPSEIVVELDGRLLPGFSSAQMLSELRVIAGDEIELEVLRHDGNGHHTDMGLYDMLAGILMEAEPGSVPFPYLLPGVTDGRYFASLGIQTYGFMPLKLPRGFDRLGLVHAADERVPVEAIEFGTRAIYEALKRYKI